MSTTDKIFEEAAANILELSEQGIPFHGKTTDPDKTAKFEILKRAAADLAESPFVEKVTVDAASTHRNAQVLIDLPAAATFRSDRKDKLPAILNLADTYTIIKTASGVRVTATILDLWKER